MAECGRVQRLLYQYVADGEPTLPEYRRVQAHLETCADCRAQVERLRSVELGLRTMPAATPPNNLVPAIMRQVVVSTQPRPEEWQLFSWEVWVPIVAVAAALLIAMISMPSGLFTSMTLLELETAARELPTNGTGWFAPLGGLTRSEIFWVVWTSLFVTTAGIGLGLSLKHLNRAATSLLSEMQGRFAGTASRLLRRTRDAH